MTHEKRPHSRIKENVVFLNLLCPKFLVFPVEIPRHPFWVKWLNCSWLKICSFLCIFQDKLIRQLEKESSSNAQDGGVDGDQKAKVAPWRFGPAQLWYDRMGIDETGENFDYGFRLKSVSTWYCN